MTLKQVRARFRNGVLEPLDDLGLSEDEEVLVTVEATDEDPAVWSVPRTLPDMYEDYRKASSRPSTRPASTVPARVPAKHLSQCRISWTRTAIDPVSERHRSICPIASARESDGLNPSA